MPTAHLASAAVPVPLVLDLRIAHERWEVVLTLVFIGNCIYPADLDRLLNEAAADTNLQYRADYNNGPSTAISFMPALDAYTVNLCAFYFRRLIGKLTACSFRSSACAINLSLPSRGILFTAQV